ncbi:MAG: serine protease [Candidatus Paceibacterota bacterium]|jgi:S1-C subfamily serine protease
MEDLTKHQLILIVLLITFVTSIATGIITFTLLSEAPVEVTQNISRVVERTIERVVTEPGKPDKVTTTVVVSEEDRVLESIAKNEKSIVRLKTIGSDGSEIFSGLGLVVSAEGVIVADLRSYNAASAFTILFFDGKSYPSGKVFVDNVNGLVFIKTNVPQSDAKYTFYPTTFGDSDSLKIGQTLVAISGRDSNAASIGRVFQLSFATDKKTVTNILSDIKVSKSHFGSPILNLTGEVIGLEAPVGEAETEYSFLPINFVKTSTTKALAELSK